MKRKQIYLLSLAFIGLMGRSNAQCGFKALGPNDSLNRIAFGEAEYEAVAVDPTTNSPLIAVRDGNNLNYYGASVSTYASGTWQLVGQPGFTYGKTANSYEIYDEALTVNKHGVPYLACEAKGFSNHCAVYSFNGTTWDTVGSQVASFTIPCQYIAIATDSAGTPYVAYEDLGTTKVDVLRYDDTTMMWKPVGGSLGISKGQAQYISLAFDKVHNIPYVSYEDMWKPHARKLMVLSYTGGAWSTPGGTADTGGVSVGAAMWTSITSDKAGNVFVSYEDFSDAGNIGVMEYNGTSWVADTATRNKYLAGPVNYTSIGVDSVDNIYVAYLDSSSYGYEGLSIAKNTAGSWDYAGGSYKVSQDISAKNVLSVSLAMMNNGLPFVGYEDKGVGNHAEAFMFTGTSWQLMATEGISNGAGSGHNGLAAYTSIGISPATDVPYISYQDANNSYKATVMSYSSGANSWSVVGTPGISLGTAKFTNIGFDAAGDPICMFTDGKSSTKYSISCMKYSGGAWAAVGTNSNTLSGADAYYVSMAIANDTIYAAYELANYHMAAMKCAVNGTTWVNIGGADITGDSAAYESIAIDKNGVPYIAFQDNTANGNGISIVKYVSDSGWQFVGARNISSGEAVYPCIKIDPTDNKPVVAYSSYGAGTEANVEKFDGNPQAWNFVGAPGFSNDWTSYMSLSIDNGGAYYVAYSDWGNEVHNQGQENCTVEKFSPCCDTAWNFLPVAGSGSQNGATYEACALDNGDNFYIAYVSYGAFAKELECPTGVNEISGSNLAKANVYPDPSHGTFTVELENAPLNSSVNIFNVLGQSVYQSKLTSDKTQVNLNQAPGIYLYRILTENGQVISTGKLIVQ
ncbi:MAG: T9SS type A sorting domain-containing protein [Bacteroidia bacterium]